jgi:hypothetical protein
MSRLCLHDSEMAILARRPDSTQYCFAILPLWLFNIDDEANKPEIRVHAKHGRNKLFASDQFAA